MGAESEAVLSELCRRSFLSLWSYPNPYNDKGLAQRKEGKELCDLLVIFGNDVIIFSDKSCAYPNTGDESLDWSRWYKRAVSESVQQIYGAERWLRAHPDRVFADNRCTTLLDVGIPQATEMRVHRVVIALGARERCVRYFSGGSGSLPIRSPGAGDGEFDPLFQLGNEGRKGAFVHVLDDVALHVVLQELDTVADFVTYLTRKEDAFSAIDVIATGEEDLLSHYRLTLIRGKHDFIDLDELPQDEGRPALFVDESARTTLVDLPQYEEAIKANEPSYIWDRLVEHFIAMLRDGAFAEGPTRKDLEVALRQMASPDRVARRVLGRMIHTAVHTPDQEKIRYLATLDPTGGGVAYGVVCMSYQGNIPYDQYRARRRLVMAVYARSLRVRHDTVRRVFMLGIQPVGDSQVTEEMALIDLPEWTEEIDLQARAAMKDFGLGAPGTRFVEHEFPTRARHLGSREAMRRQRQAERSKKP